MDKDKTLIWQSKANLKRDLANLAYAQAEEKRYKELVDQGFVTKEQYGQMEATAKADMRADRA